ncbi:hypothetical protein N752_29000 [Desulforamulus aquiferis]|nr:hypothetical protein N752_29000 [Desulforamulus aquiferis]
MFLRAFKPKALARVYRPFRVSRETGWPPIGKENYLSGHTRLDNAAFL